MIKYVMSLMFVVGCGGAPEESIELGQVEQAMAFKPGPSFAYGVTVEDNHEQLQCTNVGNDECS